MANVANVNAIPTMPVNLGHVGRPDDPFTADIWIKPDTRPLWDRMTCGWPGCENPGVVLVEYRRLDGDGSSETAQCERHWQWFRGIRTDMSEYPCLVWIDNERVNA